MPIAPSRLLVEDSVVVVIAASARFRLVLLLGRPHSGRSPPPQFLAAVGVSDRSHFCAASTSAAVARCSPSEAAHVNNVVVVVDAACVACCCLSHSVGPLPPPWDRRPVNPRLVETTSAPPDRPLSPGRLHTNESSAKEQSLGAGEDRPLSADCRRRDNANEIDSTLGSTIIERFDAERRWYSLAGRQTEATLRRLRLAPALPPITKPMPKSEKRIGLPTSLSVFAFATTVTQRGTCWPIRCSRGSLHRPGEDKASSLAGQIFFVQKEKIADLVEHPCVRLLPFR